MKAAAIVCLIVLTVCQTHGQVEVMLEDVNVLVGEDAIIPCTYQTTIVGANPVIRWSVVNETDQSSRVYTFEMGKGGNRYPGVHRELSVGDNGELIVPNVTLTDNKIMQKITCEVDFEAQSSGQGKLNFKVIAFPKRNPIATLEEEEFDISEDEVLVGQCESAPGYPNPTIKFYRAGGEEIESKEEPGTESLDSSEDSDYGAFLEDVILTEEDGLTAVTKSLRIAVGKEDDLAAFFCVVTTGAGGPRTTLFQNITFPPFRVNYPTDMAEIIPQTQDAFVGEEFVLECKANGFPNPDIEFNGGIDPTTKILITKENNGETISCKAQNEASDPVFAEGYVINALYADEPMITATTEVSLGELISLSCAQSSNPPSRRIVWKKDGKTVFNSGEYEIQNAKFEDAGVYTCEVENDFEKLSRAANTKPVVVNGLTFGDMEEDEDVKGKIKETVTLSCSVLSSPKPTFVWTRKSDETEVESVLSKDGFNYTSTITVGPLGPSLSKDTYTCSVMNTEMKEISKMYHLPEMINGTTEEPSVTEVLPESASPTPGIIIGVLVALLVVAIIVAVLYNKGIICKKGEKGEEEAEDIEHVKINPDEAEPVASKPEDVEAGQQEDNFQQQNEGTQLMNGNGEQTSKVGSVSERGTFLT